MPQHKLLDQDFLEKLQKQAELQSTLSGTHILPKQTDWLSTFVGDHPWQTIVALATVSTVLMVVAGRI